MISPTMWFKALRIIPRIEKKEWDTLDIISKWLISTRAAVFIMTAISCIIGGLFAIKDGLFNPVYFLLCLIGLVFAHATNNLMNDLIDYKKGIDKDNYYRSKYGPHPLEHGLLTEKTLWIYIIVTGLIAFLSGSLLVYETGINTLYLMLAGAFFVIFYTWPLKYYGLGEPSVLLVWGPLMVTGSYYVITVGSFSVEATLIGTVYALGPTTVLFGKHTDKIEDDKKKGVYTLPVILGEKKARITTIWIWILQYVIVVVSMLFNLVGISYLLIFFAVPKFLWVYKIFSKPRPGSEPEGLPPDVWPLYLSAHSFVYNRLFGTLFMVAVLLDLIHFKYFG